MKFKKIDTYIIKKYLSTFFFTVLLITSVAVVIDLAEKVERISRDNLSMGTVIEGYYLNFIPWINGILWPLFSLLAVIFFTSRLAKDTEIVAMLSAKISYYRILRPVMIAATIIASLLWYADNYLIPKATKNKYIFENKYKWRRKEENLTRDIHFFLSPTDKVYIRYYRKRDTTAHDFRLERFIDNRLVYSIKADILKIKEPPNVWTLEHFEKRKIDGYKETIVSYTDKNPSMDTTFNFSPEDFSRYTNEMDMMSSTEIKAYIEAEQSRGLRATKKYEIELYRRSADPFTILILSLMGFVIASRKIRGGVGLNLALGIMLGSAFVIISKFAVTFASNMTLAPMIAIWLPNIVFSVVALLLLVKAQK